MVSGQLYRIGFGKSIWCGYTAHEVDSSYFVNNPEVQEMPRYPDEGSIKVIDDTLIVKF
jgi:hypothetical protein